MISEKVFLFILTLHSLPRRHAGDGRRVEISGQFTLRLRSFLTTRLIEPLKSHSHRATATTSTKSLSLSGMVCCMDTNDSDVINRGNATNERDVIYEAFEPFLNTATSLLSSRRSV